LINSRDDFEGVRRRRYGVCHRCGWIGFVANVGRRDRRRLRTDRTFGRLCDDCVTDLRTHAVPQAEQAKPAKLKSMRHRKVA